MDFKKYHSQNWLQNYRHLQVGRLVRTILPTSWPMSKTQMILHNWVFEISGLANDNPALYQALLPFGGIDATAILVGGSSRDADPLAELYTSETGRIVAGVFDNKPQRDIPSGEIALHNNPMRPEGAWVTILGSVYNVTELTDPVLSRWLINKYSFRIIGNVVQGPAWPVLDMNPEPEPEVVPSDQGWMSIHCI
ncbi:hypothetical protein UCREL1_5527 [Eutypa lata UCREL1]|uniref:Uncharacterized protein n=1 Tax=Eutypa lata (strain UCR-EL1) TaxID=1287681 RepID=M7TC60_EUTLA|nr:hypothetical protein UCREL1_5527 [Eutypa lata UCREL1]